MTPPPCKYEIRVGETLETWWSQWFLEMEITPAVDQNDPGSSLPGRQPRGTVLRGCLPDQAALFGLLSRVRDLNLTLLEVKRIAENNEEDYA